MSEQTLTTDCQFCSVVSKTNREDPIGTVGTYDYWIVTELAQPWSEEIWQQDPTIRTVLAMLKNAIVNQGMKLRPIAIAPDKEYTHPGQTRVLFYSRPAQQFARYDKTEYLISDAQLVALVQALLGQSEELAQFVAYQHNSDHVRELLVCTHGNVDAACSRFGYPIYKTLRQNYAGANLRVWRCSHFGGHRFAPTLIDLPQGQGWGHLEPDMLDQLVYRQGPVADLRRFYRGWTGLSKFVQIVERELWMEMGWDWLSYPRTGQVMQQDDADPPRWAEVRLEFQSSNGKTGACDARVALTSEITTAFKSDQHLALETVPQYQVKHLELKSH